MNCAVEGCTEPALPAYERHLCLPHGVAVQRALSAKGMDFATWLERVNAVKAWVQRQTKAVGGA